MKKSLLAVIGLAASLTCWSQNDVYQQYFNKPGNPSFYYKYFLTSKSTEPDRNKEYWYDLLGDTLLRVKEIEYNKGQREKATPTLKTVLLKDLNFDDLMYKQTGYALTPEEAKSYKNEHFYTAVYIQTKEKKDKVKSGYYSSDQIVLAFATPSDASKIIRILRQKADPAFTKKLAASSLKMPVVFKGPANPSYTRFYMAAKDDFTDKLTIPVNVVHSFFFSKDSLVVDERTDKGTQKNAERRITSAKLDELDLDLAYTMSPDSNYVNPANYKTKKMSHEYTLVISLASKKYPSSKFGYNNKLEEITGANAIYLSFRNPIDALAAVDYLKSKQKKS